MLRNNAVQARISTRAILIGAVLFNVIAVGFSEVQRRGLTYRIEEVILKQDKVRKDETVRIENEIADQGRRVAEMRSAIGALPVLIKDGRFASTPDVEAAIAQRLTEGNSIIIRFDNNTLETRDGAGAILCGPEAASGYLGAFVAGEEYTISYDKLSHQWTGSGPAQSMARDQATGKCTNFKNVYGPKELHKIVTPADALILWGASLKLNGLDISLEDKKVGRVVWVD
jgi:hypothetical protein